VYNNANTSYPLTDGLGSVRGMVNAMSDVLSTTTYSPYGVPDSPISGFAFTGEQRDTNGLQYHRARYYNAGLGTWASLDPFEGIHERPMSLNGYAYVEGNVVNAIDPSGNFPDIKDWVVALTAVKNKIGCQSKEEILARSQPEDGLGYVNSCDTNNLSLGVLVAHDTIITHDHFDGINEGRSLIGLQTNVNWLYIESKTKKIVTSIMDWTATFPVPGGGAMILKHKASLELGESFPQISGTSHMSGRSIVRFAYLPGSNNVWFESYGGFARHSTLTVETGKFLRDSGTGFLLQGESSFSRGDSGAGIFYAYSLVGVLQETTIGLDYTSNADLNRGIAGCFAFFRDLFGNYPTYGDALPGYALIAKVML
jgi:RHS repeat-associated protein